jgi:hypothetical protein
MQSQEFEKRRKKKDKAKEKADKYGTYSKRHVRNASASK